MLRLPPTQIGLNTRDLVWHADRHRSRQTRRANGHLPGTANNSTEVPASTANQRHTKLAYGFPRRLSRAGNAFRAPDEALISDEAVPQGSRLFWDGILANAQTGPARSRVFDTQPLFDSLVNTVAGGDSFEGYVEGSQVLPLGFETDNEDDVDPDHSVSSISSESANSQDAAQGKSLDHQNRQSVSKDAPQQQGTSRRRLSFRKFYRKARQGSSKDRTSRDHHAATHNDLDGSSDQTPRPGGQRIRASRADLEPSAKADPGRSRRGRRTDPSTLEVDTNVEEAITIPKPSPPISEPNDQSSPPVAMPRSVEMVIRRTSGLPRSPLHIAHAALSSSPEKRTRSPSGSTDAASPSASSFLARPPRRRRKYKPRSESYSFVASEASPVAAALTPSGDDSDDGLLSNIHDYFDNTLSTNPASSPPEPFDTHHFGPATQSPPRLPPFPGPFSATPRTVSFNLALPSSSPQTPVSPSAAPSLSSPPATSTPPPRTRGPSPGRPIAASPPPPTPHRSMRVYNDSLPPTTQPQTPLNLRRHGVVRPSFTAPPGVAGRRAYAGALPPMTPLPVRRSRGWGSEQENVGVEVEMGRRGVGSGGMGMGEAEGEGRLERTPEGEGRGGGGGGEW